MSLRLMILGVLAMGAAACTQVAPEDLAIPSSSTTELTPAATDAHVEIEALGGTIVVGGTARSTLIAPDGTEVWPNPDEAMIRQPTWSRDGRRAVMIGGGLGGASAVRVVSLDAEGVIETNAGRGYFFFSWSDGADYIAALGPGPVGTTLDILGADGAGTAQSLDAGSFYLAWEPGGDDLLVHRDRTLELVRDVTDLETREPLGAPGQSFLAPAWIPGTRHALIVAEQVLGHRLIQIDVDSGEERDLGAINGSAGIVVSPDGSRAVVAHGMAGGSADIDVAYRPIQDAAAATELVDLASGDRTMASAEPTFWAEWSPDGTKLALLQAAPEGGAVEWVIWEDGSTRSLGTALPSPAFLREYIFFSWQFVESPRIWAPDSNAIVYAAIDDDGVSGIFVHVLGVDDAVRVSDGDIAFWSPR